MALTGVSKRDDCAEKWQSSGQPPVLADKMPSISTSGPTPGQTHLMGQRGQRHDRTVGQGGQRRQLVRGEETALVEQGVLGGGDHGPVRRTQGDLGRGGRPVPIVGRGRS